MRYEVDYSQVYKLGITASLIVSLIGLLCQTFPGPADEQLK